MKSNFKTALSALLCALIFSTDVSLLSQSTDSILYKQVDSTSLYMHVTYPPSMNNSEPLPAMVFFFGGGWIGGTPGHFEPHANYFSERGLICFRVDYRVESRHGTSPFESLKDAKSAIRFIREHAEELHVDPSKIAAAGGSAGGHLAAATALVTSFNEGNDHLSYSCVPNALVLFNPVIDNGPGGYGYDRIGEAYKDFSPLHNIREGAPPTLFFLGTRDKLIPVETAQYYRIVMEKVGSRCDLSLYEGEGHGFFNRGHIENYKKTVSEANRFLISLGYLTEKPVIAIEPEKQEQREVNGSMPNIVWLVAEDISPVIPSFGDSTIVTPNLSRLASEGVRFTNVFSVSGVCSPSRAALATGMYPTRIGATHMRNSGLAKYLPEGIFPYEAMPPAEVRMHSEYLRRIGYYCTNNPKEDYQFKKTLTAWDESSPKAHWRNKKPGQPFFAIFNFNVCHESKIWVKAEDSLWVDADLEVPIPPYLPNNEVGKRDVRRNFFPDQGYYLAQDPAYQEKLKELREECDRWMAETGDMGLIPELEYIHSIWPGGIQPETLEPVIERTDLGYEITCKTNGASIGYQILSGRETTGKTWEVYTGPIELGRKEKLVAVAHRIGYKPSARVPFEN